MKKGKLSKVEKEAIESMTLKKMSTKEIAKILDRSEHVVLKHGKTFVDRLQKAKPTVKLKEPKVEESTVNAVMKRLKAAGLTNLDAQKIMDETLERAVKKDHNYLGPKGADKLYTSCMRSMKSTNLMIKKTQGGKEGVAIMTSGASQRIDDSRGARSVSRSSRGNVYNIKERRMIGDGEENG